MTPLKHIIVIVILSISDWPSLHVHISICNDPHFTFACHTAQEVKMNTHVSSTPIINICMDKRSNFVCWPGQNDR